LIKESPMSHRWKWIVGVLFVAVGAAQSASAGPIGTYYLTDYFNSHASSTLDAIQGHSYAQSPLLNPSHEGPIAVFNDTRLIRTMGTSSSYLPAGQEYASVPYLNVTTTGHSYSNTLNSSGSFADGTTDGHHNYTVDYFTGNVYSTDIHWGGPGTVLFSTGHDGNEGITYDKTNNSLWIQTLNGVITDYQMDGTLISSFAADVRHRGAAALAMDVDHTLWYALYGAGTIMHYSTSGTYLGSDQFDSMGNVFGGEIGAVPMPSSIVVLLLSMPVAFCFARHQRPR
jgi:hypothetical protein